jgi:hypothetical protein
LRRAKNFPLVIYVTEGTVCLVARNAAGEYGENALMIEATNAPLPERVRYFRELAKRAQRDARTSRGPLRLAFVRLAQRWESLANATEDLMLARGQTETPNIEIAPEQRAPGLGSHDRPF